MNKLLNYRISIKKIKHWFSDTLFKNLAINSGMLMTGTIIANVLGVVTTAIKARVLGVELFGLLSVVISYILIVNEFTSITTWQPLIKFGAQSLFDKDNEKLMGYINLSIFLDFFSALIGVICSISIAYFFSNILAFDREVLNYIRVYSLMIIFNFTFPIGVMRLLDKFKYIAIQQVITASAGLIGAFIVSYFEGGITNFLWVMVISKAIGALYIVSNTFKVLKEQGYLKNWRSTPKIWKPFVKFGWWTYLRAISDVAVKQLDVIIVSAVISISAAGIYKIIKQVGAVYGLLSAPIYQAIFPQFAKMIAAKESKGAIKFAVKIGLITFLIMIIPTLILALSSTWWLDAIFGKGFSNGALPLSIFLLFKLVAVTFNPIHPLVVSFGFVKQNMLIVLFSNFVYLLFVYFIGNLLGLVGMGVAFGIQLIIMIILKICLIRKKVLNSM